MKKHSVGYWLRLRRKALDLTQDRLADRVGCSASMIRKIESEVRRPSEQIAERLADIFNIPPNEQTNFLGFASGTGKTRLSIEMARASLTDFPDGVFFVALAPIEHPSLIETTMVQTPDHTEAERESLDKVNTSILVLSQAAVSAGTNQPERAARLSGAAQAIFERLDYRISPLDQAEFDRHIQIAREQLGVDGFGNLAIQGRAIPMEQAIAYALQM